MAETTNCNYCDTEMTDNLIKFPHRSYGFCNNACHHAGKPEAFSTDDADHNTLIPEPESPQAFTTRLITDLA
jgi:hypothetical protein